MAKTDTAFEMLRRDLLNGSHPPGAPLRIAALSTRYGVSATPLREALSRLEEKRLVVGSANRGWRAAPVSLEEFEDLQIARMTIESSLLQDAMARGGLDWESGIVAAHYRLTQVAVPLGDADTLAARQTWIETHDAFHTALLAAGRSGWLKGFYAQTAEQLQRHHQALLFHSRTTNPGARFRPAPTTEALLRKALSIPRHTELMDAVLSGDAAAALKTLRDHLDIAQAIYRSIVGSAAAADATAAGLSPDHIQ